MQNRFNCSGINLLHICQKALLEEAHSIESAANMLDESFLSSLVMIAECRGNVIISGIGKSGLVGKKISSTFCSIGKPSIFLHASEAQHGDMGVIKDDDLLICISNSGDTEELCQLARYIKRREIPIISITNNKDSKLARICDVVLLTHVTKEACKVNLAPTTSTTVTLALGDALAIGLEQILEITPEKFAASHPSGSLGKKLLLKIGDLMVKDGDMPAIQSKDSLKSVIVEISRKRLGFCSIVNDKNDLVGIITDGDIRRLLERSDSIRLNQMASDIMTLNPKFCKDADNAHDVLKTMNRLKINVMPVLNEHGELIGAIHMQTLVKEFGG